MAYEPVSNFDSLRCFLELNEREFELFKKSYQPSKDFFIGEKKDLGFRDLKRLEKENKLPNTFKEPLLERAKAKLSGNKKDIDKIEDSGSFYIFLYLLIK